MNLVCTALNPAVNIFQGYLDVVFGLFSFIGLAAPNAKSAIGGLFGCTF